MGGGLNGNAVFQCWGHSISTLNDPVLCCSWAGGRALVMLSLNLIESVEVEVAKASGDHWNKSCVKVCLCEACWALGSSLTTCL